METEDVGRPNTSFPSSHSHVLLSHILGFQISMFFSVVQKPPPEEVCRRGGVDLEPDFWDRRKWRLPPILGSGLEGHGGGMQIWVGVPACGILPAPRCAAIHLPEAAIQQGRAWHSQTARRRATINVTDEPMCKGQCACSLPATHPAWPRGCPLLSHSKTGHHF